MNKVVHFFENLSDKQKEHLIHSPTIRDAFSEDLADDFDLSKEEIRNTLEELIGNSNLKESFKIPQLRLQKKRVSWDKGGNF